MDFRFYQFQCFLLRQMFMIRVWDFIHTLPLPPLLVRILQLIDHALEIGIRIISEIISWIVGRAKKENEPVVIQEIVDKND